MGDRQQPLGVHFSVRHMVVAKVRGQFARWTGSVLADGGDLAPAKGSVVIDTSSIDTFVSPRVERKRKCLQLGYFV